MRLALVNPVVILWVFIGLNRVNGAFRTPLDTKFELKLFNTLLDFELARIKINIVIEFSQIRHVQFGFKPLNILNDFSLLDANYSKVFFNPDIVDKFGMSNTKCIGPLLISIGNQVIIKLASLQFNNLFIVLNQRHIQVKHIILRIVQQKIDLTCFRQLPFCKHNTHSHFPRIVRPIVKDVWGWEELTHRGVNVQRLPTVYLVYWC